MPFTNIITLTNIYMTFKRIKYMQNCVCFLLKTHLVEIYYYVNKKW